MPDKIRVLIVDDSALMRDALKSILESDGSIEVVGTAKNGMEGVEKAMALKPNVITMDLKMPMMDGLEAVERIMEENPIPIVVVSSMDIKIIVRALAIGAMDFVPVTGDMNAIANDLLSKVKIASRIKPIRRLKVRTAPPVRVFKRPEELKVLAIGISTGGPQALQAVLSHLPADFPGAVLIVQHMSKGFIGGLVEWLKYSTKSEIKVAADRDQIKSSTILIAPDDCHMEAGGDGRIHLTQNTDRTIVHIPSIDVMMKSVADSYGRNAIGLIMTGMGKDGVEGMRAIKKAGGMTIAQDEKTSTIFGMNKVAIECQCVDRVVPLERIVDEILDMISKENGKAK
jgi:two-component system chemotaxis response regulator CheB